jgi:hypothetical protein
LGCFLVIAGYISRFGRWRNVIREYTRAWLKHAPGHTESSEPMPKSL